MGLDKETIEKIKKSKLKELETSFLMYEKSLQENLQHMSNDKDKNGNRKYSDSQMSETQTLIKTMQNDVINQYAELGGDVDYLKSLKEHSNNDFENRKKTLLDIINKEKNITNTEYDNIENDELENNTYSDDELVRNEDNDDELTTNTDKTIIDLKKTKGGTIQYDLIPLPSKGQAYKNKLKKIPVSYLTAYDENLIVSPNLYQNGTFLDYMIKSKVMTDEIDTDDLLPGDRDAIILWLRANGYGPNFPVQATDNITGQQFDTVVDLNTLEYKKFNLKSDKNGYFSFTLPSSKDKIKFKFLSYKEIKKLEEIGQSENLKLKKEKLIDISDTLNNIINNDEEADKQTKLNIRNAISSIKNYSDSIEEKDDILYTHSVTNRLIASIMSINGVSDRNFIKDYVMYMNVKDSSALRKYITENEPGIDFNITIEKPKSLGGGSMTLFLSIDQYIFLNIA